MDKVLVICGPTGVGKTGFGLEMAKKFNGELISADSRQVYKGMDIITGKDLPAKIKAQRSNIEWKDRNLCFYEIQGVKFWLYDIVNPDEDFNVSFWNECARLVITDILSRGKFPIIVGGTGLYIKSLTHNLDNISIPPDDILRKKLELLDTESLFHQLKSINSQRADSLNNSDRHNPRRLIRAIETSSGNISTNEFNNYKFLQIGLTASLVELENRITARVEERICNGALKEYEDMKKRYDNRLPSMSTLGYKNWLNWLQDEKKYAKRQLTWFKKYPEIKWFDINSKSWKTEAENTINTWYTSR